MKEHYNNPMIQKAFNLLETLSADKETRLRAESREKALINEAILMAGERRKGMEEGIKKGQRKANKETASALLKMGIMSIEQVAEVTKLGVEEVKKLKQDLMYNK